MKMPLVIAEVLLKMWRGYVKSTYINAIDTLSLNSIVDLEIGVQQNRNAYLGTLERICTQAKQDHIFWWEVIKGDYNLYFDSFPPKPQEIIIDDQKFMI